MTTNDEIRRKFALLEESWSKTEDDIQEDAVPAMVAPAIGTATTDVANVKKRLGEDAHGDAGELTKFAKELDHFLFDYITFYDDESKAKFLAAAEKVIQSEKSKMGGEAAPVAHEVAPEPVAAGGFAEEFHHKEKKDFPPQGKEKKDSTGKEQAERQLKLDQSVEQPAAEVLGKTEEKKKTVKKEEIDLRYRR